MGNFDGVHTAPGDSLRGYEKQSGTTGRGMLYFFHAYPQKGEPICTEMEKNALLQSLGIRLCGYSFDERIEIPPQGFYPAHSGRDLHAAACAAVFNFGSEESGRGCEFDAKPGRTWEWRFW